MFILLINKSDNKNWIPEKTKNTKQKSFIKSKLQKTLN